MAAVAPPPVMHEMMMDSDDEGGPVSSFQSYAAEGDILAKQGDYRKSIEAYTKALTLRPGEKNCLVCRSKCHLQLGDSQAALEDANLSLKGDPEFFKGTFQKAEALYAKGDFEMALVYYHRGNKLRPELNEFRLGIQKAREAIDNSIGNPKDYKFQAPAALKNLALLQAANGGKFAHLYKGAAGLTDAVRNIQSPVTIADSFGGQATSTTPASIKREGSAKSDKTVKQLLGELYADKLYLEQLLNDRDFINNPNDDISALVSEALRYLDTRTEFWRQQKPIYARRKEHSSALAKEIATRYKHLLTAKASDFKHRTEMKNNKNSRTEGQSSHVIKAEQKSFETGFKSVQKAIDRGDFDNAKRTAENLQEKLGEILNIKRKNIYSGECFALLGNVHFGMQNYALALSHHKRDLALGYEIHSTDAIKRATANLGRCYVKMGRFKEAAHMFQERLKLANSNNPASAGTTSQHSFESANNNSISKAAQQQEKTERAWLLHDLARCNLEMNNVATALDFAQQSVQSAEQSKDNRWCLNSKILLGQIQVRQEQFQQASTSYNSALSHAKDLGDVTTQDSIHAIIKDIHHKLNPAPASTMKFPKTGGSPESNSNHGTLKRMSIAVASSSSNSNSKDHTLPVVSNAVRRPTSTEAAHGAAPSSAGAATRLPPTIKQGNKF